MTSQANDQNIHRHRMLMVVKALRETPAPAAFNMENVLHECGTPACAYGHYVCRTDLQDFVRPAQSVFVDTGRPFWKPVFVGTDRYASFSGEEVRDHFGITDGEQCDLFDGGGCGCANTAAQAARYIEHFVARKWPSPESIGFAMFRKASLTALLESPNGK